MTPCNCHLYQSKPATLEDVRTRCEVSEDILPSLAYVASGEHGDLHVYRCIVCGRLWAEESPFGIEYILGEKGAGRGQCLYMIEAVDARLWLNSNQPFTYALKQEREDQEFYEQLGDGVEEDVCQQEGCGDKRIRYSVMCRKHHFEMVRRRECLFR